MAIIAQYQYYYNGLGENMLQLQLHLFGKRASHAISPSFSTENANAITYFDE